MGSWEPDISTHGGKTGISALITTCDLSLDHAKSSPSLEYGLRAF